MHPVRLRGARTHNLQNVDLVLTPGEFIALTGPSGAGKSSLALDTLYAEGQRRFVESFSPYARQFLERLERPPIDQLDPVAATVAVDRRAPVKSSRSTLATMADLEPYLAALFAREAVPTCPTCGIEATAATPAQATENILTAHAGARAVVSYPVELSNPEAFLQLRDSLISEGYRRLVVGGTVRDLDVVRPSEATGPDVRVEVVVDRVTLGTRDRRRLQEAIETAWQRSAGRAELRTEAPRPTETGAGTTPRSTGELTAAIPLRQGLACPKCSRAFERARSGLFSYNSPLGACEPCRGFGRTIDVAWEKVIPDETKSIAQGAIRPWTGKSSAWERKVLADFAKRKKIDITVPWKKLTAAQRELIFEGEGGWTKGKFPGLRAWFKWLETRTYKMHVRVFLSRYREYRACDACNGARLNATALTYRVARLNLAEWHGLTVAEAAAKNRSIRAVDAQGERVQEALGARLDYLERVGLGYLTLDRPARTLSGGEAQRAGLTNALGAALTGTLFVLDEPTVGLHSADIPALSGVMRQLARAGNTVMVIEHDESVVRATDRVFELGPGAGTDGGRLLFEGTPNELARRTDLPTGRAWARTTNPLRKPREPKGFVVVHGARANNLKGITATLPLGVVCAITGPSGSGKSTLAVDVLYRGIAHALGETGVDRAGLHDRLEGVGALARTVLVDQSPLGRTARGNAATYTKAWDRIRARFAAEFDAVRGGLTPAHFSFNVAAGRCATCSGEGYETVEMQFLADVSLLCPVCQGKRFRPEVLAIKHRGRSVHDVLSMTVDTLLAEFDPPKAPDPKLRQALDPVRRVGLGYLPVGQPLSTLSGGEAQRLKLARALGEKPAGTLFVIDEPSAGLHAEDAAYVVQTLHALVDEGASVIVVEHDLDVIRETDWILDLGPGAGPLGGTLAAVGSPEIVARSKSKTGIALRDHLLGTHRKASPKVVDIPAVEPAIKVDNAREHNLKGVSCSIPHGKLCVFTGPSGSGKSSLAFDVIFAEGQRRFMETLTPYARQFLPTLPRPEVDSVRGVPPSIALEQRTARGGANSTVATVTEVAHYLRLLYAKVGDLYCPKCESLVAPTSPDALFARLTGKRDRTRKTIYAPAVRARKGTYLDLFTQASRSGLISARVDGVLCAIDPPPKLAKSREHTIDLILYYGPLNALDRETFDRALGWGAGSVRVASGPPAGVPDGPEEVYSTARACTECGTGLPELDPRWFSFNTKQGQCEACEGSGVEGGPEALEHDEKPRTCTRCKGTRLAAVPRRVRLANETYASFTGRSVREALAQAKTWKFSGNAAIVAEASHTELLRRLAFVDRVGLGYLALDRPAMTLSGGEMQRLRLSAQLGSGLTGALYVLDEPTIGLHPRDTQTLLTNLRALVDTGSTVLVVEHDAETIRAADYVLDFGPSGGRGGGNIVMEGSAEKVLSSPDSPTARALVESARIERPKRPDAKQFLTLRGASAHNLKKVTFTVPVGRLTAVAGVSGSGKSTLVRQVFYPALRRALGLVAPEPGRFDSLKGVAAVKRALAVDQSPIGRSPRSTPATFLGVWDDIRRLFASLPEGKTRGYTPARFSFNSAAAGGRCAACAGQGAVVSEMAFLPDVVSPCETCGGARFEPATLEVQYAGMSVGDVLRLSAADAADAFAAHPRIHRPLETLRQLGVGYLQLGQGSNTLSGGEAQRLKLASELTAGSSHEPTVYVLDEPTTGLHLTDVRRLLTTLERLIERGDTLVVIEHHPDVIASADWVIELGPEAGKDGGSVVFEGAPKDLMKAKTATGAWFRAH